MLYCYYTILKNSERVKFLLSIRVFLQVFGISEYIYVCVCVCVRTVLFGASVILVDLLKPHLMLLANFLKGCVVQPILNAILLYTI